MLWDDLSVYFMYSSNWLIMKAIQPIARHVKVRQNNQTENSDEERGKSREMPANG